MCGVGSIHYSPSDDMDAPDSLKSSEPIWIGKTLPEGSISVELWDSTTRLGVETSTTRPCGPVPLLSSLRLGGGSNPDWDVLSRVAGAVIDAVKDAGGRRSGVTEVVATGEMGDAMDEVREVWGRFVDLSSADALTWEMPELGSESAFLFMLVDTDNRRDGLGGGDKGFCTTAG